MRGRTERRRSAGAARLAGVLLGVPSMLAAFGCASARQDDGADAAATAESPGYFAARGRELARSFDLSLSIGPGLGVRAAVTRHAQLGILAVDATDPAPHHLQPFNVTVGLRDGRLGAWSLRQVEYGLSPWYYAEALERPLESSATEQRVDPGAARGTGLSAQVHLGIVGAEVGFDPVEFGRFLIGLFGFGEGGFL